MPLRLKLFEKDFEWGKETWETMSQVFWISNWISGIIYFMVLVHYLFGWADNFSASSCIYKSTYSYRNSFHIFSSFTVSFALKVVSFDISSQPFYHSIYFNCFSILTLSDCSLLHRYLTPYYIDFQDQFLIPFDQQFQLKHSIVQVQHLP